MMNCCTPRRQMEDLLYAPAPDEEKMQDAQEEHEMLDQPQDRDDEEIEDAADGSEDSETFGPGDSGEGDVADVAKDKLKDHVEDVSCTINTGPTELTVSLAKVLFGKTIAVKDATAIEMRLLSKSSALKIIFTTCRKDETMQHQFLISLHSIADIGITSGKSSIVHVDLDLIMMPQFSSRAHGVKSWLKEGVLDFTQGQCASSLKRLRLTMEKKEGLIFSFLPMQENRDSAWLSTAESATVHARSY